MRPVSFIAAAVIVATHASAYAAESEAIGPFVLTEPDNAVLIMLVCARQPGHLDCQFAATHIRQAAKSGECNVTMNSYPVSLKANGDGRWAGTKAVPQCRTGRTDYKVELDDKNRSAGARLVISGCSGAPPSVFAFDTKGIRWTPNCAALTTLSHPATIDRIRKSR